MFWQRTVSAVILVAVVLSGFLFTNLWARLVPIVFLVVVALVGVIEACRLLRRIGLPARVGIVFPATLCLCASCALGELEHLPLILAVTMILGFLAEMRKTACEAPGAVEGLAGSALALLWVGLPLALALDLYVSSDLFSLKGVEGRRWLKLAFAVVWTTDSFAYIAGKNFGRHKLTPISPKKTWEGAVGGFLGGGILIPLALMGALPQAYPWSRALELLLVSCGMSVLAQWGDLAESLVKRRAGAKDSGVTFTGHGGVLDIIDGLLFACAGLWCYVWIAHRAALS